LNSESPPVEVPHARSRHRLRCPHPLPSAAPTRLAARHAAPGRSRRACHQGKALARVPAWTQRKLTRNPPAGRPCRSEQGMNVARIRRASRRTCPSERARLTINRFCSSGLQAIALAGRTHPAPASAEFHRRGRAPNPWFPWFPWAATKFRRIPGSWTIIPDAYINMGLGTEKHRAQFGIQPRAGRPVLRQFPTIEASRPPSPAGNFQGRNRFPVEVKDPPRSPNGNGHPSKAKSAPKPSNANFRSSHRRTPPADTSLDILAKLSPLSREGYSHRRNSSPMSDGAAAAFIMSDAAPKFAGPSKPSRVFVAYATAGVLPEESGIGPVQASLRH